jgi:hypothetical protein
MASNNPHQDLLDLRESLSPSQRVGMDVMLTAEDWPALSDVNGWSQEMLNSRYNPPSIGANLTINYRR